MKEIVLGGGCFWGVEEYFSRIPGVNGTKAATPTAPRKILPMKKFAPEPRIMWKRSISNTMNIHYLWKTAGCLLAGHRPDGNEQTGT